MFAGADSATTKNIWHAGSGRASDTGRQAWRSSTNGQGSEGDGGGYAPPRPVEQSGLVSGGVAEILVVRGGVEEVLVARGGLEEI